MSNLINNEWLENQKNSDCLDLKLLEENLKNISDQPISSQNLDSANELIDFFIEKIYKMLFDSTMDCESSM